MDDGDTRFVRLGNVYEFVLNFLNGLVGRGADFVGMVQLGELLEVGLDVLLRRAN